MPPKKKGKLTSPIVVGTVSTRSTRRQSVVNIEIPKTKPRYLRKSNVDLTVVGGSFHNSSENIKECIQTSTVEELVVKPNQEIIPQESQNASQNSKNSQQGNVSLSNPVQQLASNKALLQILEDWSDDESQEDKRCTSNLFNCSDDTDNFSNKHFDNLEFGTEDINKIIKGNHKVGKSVNSFLMENKDETLVQTEQVLDTYIENKNVEVILENSDKQEETTDDITEIISTENDTTDIILECVTDEIYSDNTIVAITEYSEQTNMLVNSDNDQEKELQNLSADEAVMSPNVEMDVIIGNEDTSSTVDPRPETSDNVIEETTNQSISTSDSNDSEVRKFFSKEIEKNETIIQKPIPRLGGMSVIKDIEFTENKIDKEVEIENKSSKDVTPGLYNDPHDNIDMEGELKNTTEGENSYFNCTEGKESILESAALEEVDVLEEIVEEIVETPTSEFQTVEEIEVMSEEKSNEINSLRSNQISVEYEDVNSNNLEEQIVETSITEENEIIPGELDIRQAAEESSREKKNTTEINDADLEKKVAGLNLKDPDSLDTMDITDKVAELKLETPKYRYSKELEQLLKDDNINKVNLNLERGERLKKILNRSKLVKTENAELTISAKNSKPRENKIMPSKVPKIPKLVKEKKSLKSSNSKESIGKLNEQKGIQKPLKEVKSKKKTFLALSSKKTRETLEKKEEHSSERKEKKFKIEDISSKKVKLVESIEKKDKKIKTEENLERKDKGLKVEENLEKKLIKTESDQEKPETDTDESEVRRSSRIKSISILKKRTTGHGLVRSKSEPSLNESDISDSNSTITESDKGTPSASPKIMVKERKTRWSKSNENISFEQAPNLGNYNQEKRIDCEEKLKILGKDPVVEARLKQFVHLKENQYKTDRMTCKEAKKMTCDCFLTPEEIGANEYGCGEDCLNRLLLIECGNLCQVGDRCTNKRFQKGQFAPVEVFNTEKIGLGLRAAANIPFGEFILEYVGEVLDSGEFDKRAEVYSQDKNIHFYFMALRADAIIDATMKGNISRFINHSCDPNAETQKWTVNGELRIGFFSTRTILAGEEITFDYKFQRYGKEAQKCFCGAAICRGWLGEQPDSEEEEEEEEYDEEESEVQVPSTPEVKLELTVLDIKPKDEEVEKLRVTDQPLLPEESKLENVTTDVKAVAEHVIITSAITPEAKVKKKITKKKLKPRIELFEEIDQLNEDIEMLITTGLKNQQHTLKLSRLMVRAKEPQQRTKLLKILRRGELPCRRLFLDYHGLRLMHGYMIDAQHLVSMNKKYESLRLEMLQTLAVLPIPNKTMLQDSKVLSTVEKWASKDFSSPGDSESNSPKMDQDSMESSQKEMKPKEMPELKKEDGAPERSIEEQEEEIRFLAGKLLEEWSNLKEVFRIPKKERIEQMKEHEREANKKFMQSSYGMEQVRDRNPERYRSSSKYKIDRDRNRKNTKSGEKYSAEFLKLSRIERRKLFALQYELKEEERRLKQREMWRQHEMNCMMIGSDPRFTAPFDPSKPYQLIWNPQLGQWQNYPLPQNSPLLTPQPLLPTLNMQLPQIQKSIPYQFTSSINIGTNIGSTVPQMPSKNMQMQANVPQMSPLSVLSGGLTQTMPAHSQGPVQLPTSSTSHLINSLPSHLQTQNQHSLQIMQQTLLNSLPQNSQITSGLAPNSSVPISHLPEQKVKKKEDDPCKVKFMGPIPPPVKLPPKWKCANDKYGRPYYYHIKIRKSQWEPPPLEETVIEEQEEFSETDSSSDTSSISSDSSSENTDSEEEIDDTKLLLAVRKQMESASKLVAKTANSEQIRRDQLFTPTPSPKEDDFEMEVEEENTPFQPVAATYSDIDTERPSIDIRLKEQFNFRDDKPPKKKRRMGLCEEILIEPRSEEDKLQAKEDLKRYKANKEKLRRQKELIVQQTKKQLRELELKKIREKTARMSVKVKIKEMPEFNSENAKKIKETFKNNMASTVVNSLNVYRKSDCKEGKITNTEDFKHLARKLTHFVMLKELKHITKIEELTCTDNVKMKAREYIRKYMSKFGEVYVKRSDSPEFKD